MNNPFDEINDRLEKIEVLLSQLIRSNAEQEPKEENILNVQGAADFLHESKATIYSRTSRREIPFYKRGKRIYFKRVELIEWLERGRKQTVFDIMK